MDSRIETVFKMKYFTGPKVRAFKESDDISSNEEIDEDTRVTVESFCKLYNDELKMYEEALNNKHTIPESDDDELEIKVVTKLPEYEHRRTMEEFDTEWKVFLNKVYEFNMQSTTVLHVDDEEVMLNTLENHEESLFADLHIYSLEEFLRLYSKLYNDVEGLRIKISSRIQPLRDILSVLSTLDGKESLGKTAIYRLSELFHDGLRVFRKYMVKYITLTEYINDCIDDD